MSALSKRFMSQVTFLFHADLGNLITIYRDQIESGQNHCATVNVYWRVSQASIIRLMECVQQTVPADSVHRCRITIDRRGINFDYQFKDLWLMALRRKENPAPDWKRVSSIFERQARYSAGSLNAKISDQEAIVACDT